jgi:hypothetical protein
VETITIFIPMTWKRRGGQKVIIAPDGGDAWAPAKARPDETLIRALARAHRWKEMLEAGRYCSAQEIAEAEKIGRSFVSRLLRLTLLAPDIRHGFGKVVSLSSKPSGGSLAGTLACIAARPGSFSAVF